MKESPASQVFHFLSLSRSYDQTGGRLSPGATASDLPSGPLPSFLFSPFSLFQKQTEQSRHEQKGRVCQ